MHHLGEYLRYTISRTPLHPLPHSITQVMRAYLVPIINVAPPTSYFILINSSKFPDAYTLCHARYYVSPDTRVCPIQPQHFMYKLPYPSMVGNSKAQGRERRNEERQKEIPHTDTTYQPIYIVVLGETNSTPPLPTP